ncbi:hypothetical protein GCM10025884_19910 [Leuconostoc gelidum subsp. gelidum]|nr:hypothetical protein GCM10025884_19910 [Leuconostoc gelidum subsp. gelidum]
MKLTSKTIEQLLIEQQLLVSKPNIDMAFDFLHYDTRQVKANTLLVVKGSFRAEYLTHTADIKGLITETVLDVSLPQWQVTNVQKALAVLSMAFLITHNKPCGLALLQEQKVKQQLRIWHLIS